MVYEIDPTADERWGSLIESHRQASIFHTRAWLEALRKTYNYKPVAYTTSRFDEPLTNATPFCEITGLFGKRRLVSLPFSDYCEPLVQSPEHLESLARYLRQKRDAERWDYVELRPVDSVMPSGSGFEESQRFCFHRLDLRPSEAEIFRNLHKDCVQRKIRRAEKEGLVYEKGVSEKLLRQFYRLLTSTRRRQGLPIQPMAWFRNLMNYFGNSLSFHVVSKDRKPIAGILTFRHKQTLVYKYGCSERVFSKFGGMQMALWRAIEEAKRDQVMELDLGRSDFDNTGLIAFKNRWGAAKTDITYYRHGTGYSERLSKAYRGSISRYVWSQMPNVMVAAAGRVLYRHLG